LNTFAIGFGLAGLAEVWSKSSPALSLPRAVPQTFWAVAAIAWVWLIAAHLVRGSGSGQRLADQLRHPAQGPIASLVMVVAMLLAADLYHWSATAGRLMFLLALTAAAAFAAWLHGYWFGGGHDLDSLHPGYLLPTVAPGLIGADVAHVVGLRGLAWPLFSVGTTFAVLMTAIVVMRLTFRAPLPEALRPTMAILLAPPAVAGLAWFSLQGHTADPVAQSLAGLTVVLLLVQAAMLPRYRRLRFSLGFWSFTFPLAATVALAIEWIELAEPPGGKLLTGVLTAAFTVFVAAIAACSLRLVARRPNHRAPSRSTGRQK
jgi:tellurite resistance protein